MIDIIHPVSLAAGGLAAFAAYRVSRHARESLPSPGFAPAQWVWPLAPLAASAIALAISLAGFLADEWLISAHGIVLSLFMIGAMTIIVRARPAAVETPLTDIVSATTRLDEPKIAFHFSDAELASPTHVEMWAEALDASGIEWYAICREPRHHAYLVEAGRVRSVLVDKASDLRAAIPPSVKVVVYANNAQKNREALRERPDLIHVQMLHGDSDKPPSYSPLTRNFDKVFVSGQMGEDRYAMNGVFIPEDKFVHVGRPQSANMSRGARGEVGTIVYMPTWLGHYGDSQFSSLDRAAEVIYGMGRARPDLKIIFKPHPLSFKHPSWPSLKRRIDASLKSVGGSFAPAEMTAFDAYETADVLVTDISSTMIDFLYTDRPQVVILPEGQSLKEARFPSLSAAYRVNPDLSDLTEKFLDATGSDSLAHDRQSVRKYAFGDQGGSGDVRFMEALRHLVDASTASEEGRPCLKQPERKRPMRHRSRISRRDRFARRRRKGRVV